MLASISRLADMFWERVCQDSPDGCWTWTGNSLPAGYGIITHNQKINGRWTGKTVYAHRLSYEIHHGEIPDGFMVMHKCDNPPCTNPNHLIIGTAQDNLNDMVKKGRHPTIKFVTGHIGRTPGEALYLQRVLERKEREKGHD